MEEPLREGDAGSTRQSPMWPKAEKTTEKSGGVGVRKACKENY